MFLNFNNLINFIAPKNLFYIIFDRAQLNFIVESVRMLCTIPLLYGFLLITLVFIVWGYILHIDSGGGQSNSLQSASNTRTATPASSSGGEDKDTDGNNNKKDTPKPPVKPLSGEELLKSILEDKRDLLDAIDPKTGLTYYEITRRLIGSKRDF